MPIVSLYCSLRIRVYDRECLYDLTQKTILSPRATKKSSDSHTFSLRGRQAGWWPWVWRTLRYSTCGYSYKVFPLGSRLHSHHPSALPVKAQHHSEGHLVFKPQPKQPSWNFCVTCTPNIAALEQRLCSFLWQILIQMSLWRSPHRGQSPLGWKRFWISFSSPSSFTSLIETSSGGTTLTSSLKL
jgi:hypothetical protein